MEIEIDPDDFYWFDSKGRCRHQQVAHQEWSVAWCYECNLPSGECICPIPDTEEE